jgi:aryl-alcohol dehydrogenase-like predicted oxidoreductase
MLGWHNGRETMIDRRTFITASSLAAIGAGLPAMPLWAAQALQQRPIPSSGEMLPVIGMGTSGSFEVKPGSPEQLALRDVLRRFFDAGASVIDTSPNYSNAEDILGELLVSQDLRAKTFLATKLAADNRAAGEAQFAQSLQRLHSDRIDLLQVHNLRDWRTQLGLARELKAQGKVRYIGVTHFLDTAHDTLADVVKAEKPDFLQINYSVASTHAEKRVLPMARDLGVAVIINRAFEDGKLFAQVANRALPTWAAQVGVSSWAQLFLKFALSHPAVTVVIPATGKPHRQSDNLGAGYGATLDQAQRDELKAMFG